MDINEQKDYAWKYFELHANQRMSTFNFFIVIAALMTTALAKTFERDFQYSYVGIILGIGLSLSAYIFWKLDQRVRFLIKHAEGVLKEIELHWLNNLGEDKFLSNLFTGEDAKTSNNKKIFPLIYATLSYSNCFNIIYLLFGLFGILGFVGSMAK